ncbi:MAG: hypothetical protein H6712_11820 [Myxococcales bacterium]|nr:hypothetical protein [Myxococcales bacterium]MCB9714542.1 hypothetical protein [Myxococcales bacterium]
MSERRYWIWALIVLAIGVALRWRSFLVGFGMDDFAQLAMLGDAYPVHREPWDLFSFSRGTPEEVHALMSRGSLAWWSWPELKLSAMRPLSSLLMWVDVRLFGHQAVWHHLHTMLWWAVMLLCAALLLRRLLPPRWAALALLLYALDECHTYPIGWLANRNAIISATFAFLALWAHVRHREDGWGKGRWLAPLLLVVSFTGGEYALCILPFFVLYELVSAPGSRAQRARALLPMLAVFVVYTAVHRGLGFGTLGSNVYVDPVREPGAYLGMVALRLPLLVADLFLAVPTGRMSISHQLMELQAGLGPVALVLIAGLAAGARRSLDPALRRRLLWLLLAAVLSVLPVSSSFVSARLLLIPALAGHAVIAAVILDAWDRVRDRAQRLRPLGLLRTVIAAALAVAHLLLAPWWGLEEMTNIHQVNLGTRRASLAMQVDDAKVARQRLVVLTAGDPMSLLYPALVRWADGHPLPRSWWVLSMAPHRHLLTRTAPGVLELEVEGGSMLTGPVEQLFRHPDRPLAAGDVVALDGLRIEVLRVDGDGRPVKVRYAFETPVDDGSIVFLLMTKRGMIRYPMGPVGATMMIPPAQLPMVLDDPA